MWSLGPTPVGAQQRPDWLRVTGEAGCLSTGRLADHVRRHLAGGAPTGAVVIEVRSSGAGATFSVLEAGEVTARRSFASLPHGCPARLDALGIAIALAVENVGAGTIKQDPDPLPDPLDESATLPSEPIEAGAQRPAASSPNRMSTVADKRRTSEQVARNVEASRSKPPSTPLPPAQTPRGARMVGELDSGENPPEESPNPSPSALHPGLVLGAGAAAGVQPDLSGLLLAGVELRIAQFAFEVAGLWLPEMRAQLAGLQTGGVDTSVYGGRASACVGTPMGVVRTDGCAGLLSGLVIARGAGLDRGQRATLGLFAWFVGVRARIPARTPLGLRLRVDLHHNIVQPTLVVTGTAGTTEGVGAVGVTGVIEAHWALP